MDKRATVELVKAEYAKGERTIKELCDEHGITQAVYQYYTNAKRSKSPAKKSGKVPVILKSPATFVHAGTDHLSPPAGKALVIVVPTADLGLLLRGLL